MLRGGWVGLRWGDGALVMSAKVKQMMANQLIIKINWIPT